MYHRALLQNLKLGDSTKNLDSLLNMPETMILESRNLKISYNVPEKNGLLGKFGNTVNTRTLINNVFMVDAHYLATTYLESVYTFKTISMPPLLPTVLSPPTLAEAQPSVDKTNYDVDSTPFSPDDYYSVPYADLAPPRILGTIDGLLADLGIFSTDPSVTADAVGERNRAADESIIGSYDSSYTIDRTAGTTPGGSY